MGGNWKLNPTTTNAATTLATEFAKLVKGKNIQLTYIIFCSLWYIYDYILTNLIILLSFTFIIILL